VKQITNTNSGHETHKEQPQLVVDSIRDWSTRCVAGTGRRRVRLPSSGTDAVAIRYFLREAEPARSIKTVKSAGRRFESFCGHQQIATGPCPLMGGIASVRLAALDFQASRSSRHPARISTAVQSTSRLIQPRRRNASPTQS
jgi:hypothetical protein